jgi:hypothetical protein
MDALEVDLRLAAAHCTSTVGQRLRDVLERSQMREERIGLEDETDPPRARRNVDSPRRVKPSLAGAGDSTRRDRCQSGDGPKRRRFAAAGWADKRKELAGSYVKHEIERDRSPLAEFYLQPDRGRCRISHPGDRSAGSAHS